MKRTISVLLFVGLILATGVPLVDNAAWAGLVTNDPSLPPTDGEYRSPAPFGPEFFGPGVQILVQDIAYRALAAPPPLRTPVGPHEQEMFESSLTGMAIITIPSFGLFDLPVPLSLLGPSVWLVSGNTTGPFTVEMVSVEFAGELILPPPFGTMPIFLRESPSLPSMGQTVITDLGGGLYHIDSFFDVFA